MFEERPFSSDERSRVRAFHWNRVKDEHFMQCFEEDEALIEGVGLFVQEALKGESAAIIIATEEHREGVANFLRGKGLDPAQLQREGRFTSLDAAETLARISVDGRVDRQRFFEVVGTLISRASNSWGEVRAFGEMVNLLWLEGKRTEALELEGLWNQLGKIYPFALFCAYSKGAFECEEDRECFSHVCEAHSMVIL